MDMLAFMVVWLVGSLAGALLTMGALWSLGWRPPLRYCYKCTTKGCDCRFGATEIGILDRLISSHEEVHGGR